MYDRDVVCPAHMGEGESPTAVVLGKKRKKVFFYT